MKNQAGAKTLICRLVLRMTLNTEKFLNVAILSLFFMIFFYRFVEIMAPVFSRDAWSCVWYLIQNDLVHGLELDVALHRCFAPPAHDKIGIIDAQWIVYLENDVIKNGECFGFEWNMHEYVSQFYSSLKLIKKSTKKQR